MEKLGRVIVRLRIPILIAAFLLLIPSTMGYLGTKVNYDVLYYLPSNIETIRGQDVLLNDFGKGAYALVMVQNMSAEERSKLTEKIQSVDHVAELISFNNLAGDTVPVELLPEKYSSKFYNKESDTTLMAIFFDDTTSSTDTMDAIVNIRKVTENRCFIAGMSAVVTDTKLLSEKETPLYVGIAVLLVCIILAVFMDSFLIPVFFMLSIGMTILYNLGSNIFLGEISYVSKALTAVLQLGVTLDYSIFLWHSFKEMKEKYPEDHNEAMAHAIGNTFTSVLGSSITTIAGFIALCFMSFTLGRDLGIVMAKGVLMGVIGCVTILPAFIMVFEKALEKTMHREIMPKFDGVARFIVGKYPIFLIIFALALAPAIYGYTNTKVYYDLSDTLPEDLNCSKANQMLKDNFDMNSMYMVLADSDMSPKELIEMGNEIKSLDGVTFALSADSLMGPTVPEEMLPEKILSNLKGENYQIMLIGSDYIIASDEINAQINSVNRIVKSHDAAAMVVGEAPCTKDLITITDQDFKVVSMVSIGAIFLIIFFVLKSVSLPVILVSVIEFAIFINMCIPFYTKTEIPFIASVVIGTIQLGATVDYAILMTTRYKRERYLGNDKRTSIQTALATSIPSVIVSALGFFAATFGVGLLASIDMISSLCMLMARGAIVSMFVVILILPSFFMIFDKIIIHTSVGFKPKKEKNGKAVPANT
ncbi:MAG: MMPL family transporter [Lachnospiraceae bacterium]|nr:MMPL family transporter [Lachnospiraceae bacterium]